MGTWTSRGLDSSFFREPISTPDHPLQSSKYGNSKLLALEEAGLTGRLTLGNSGSCNSLILYWAAAAAAKLLQSCLTLCDPIDGRRPTRLPRPWYSPGKNTGVGCHFLLECMKVKSESEVAQSCPTLGDPMDCSPPGSPVPGILQARTLEWVAISFSNA